MGLLAYNVFADMRDKWFSSITMFRTVSFLDFKADFRTQRAFTLVTESLLRFFVFISDKTENTLSESAFEFGSDLTAFKKDFKLGYFAMLIEF